MKPDNQNITIYQSNDGKISFNVNVFNETVWLTQKQMANLFDKDRKQSLNILITFIKKVN